MTTLLVDNATIAGAGRAMYAAERGTLGADHAAEYYNKNGLSAEIEDRRALFELTTALLLVDELAWEGSSTRDPEVISAFSPNDPDFGRRALDAGGHIRLAWVYRWFPVFDRLREKDILRAVYLCGEDRERLWLAQGLATRWVAQLGAEQKGRVSEQVTRIPKCYRVADHPERQYLKDQIKPQTPLSEDEISLALFVSRGLFYRSCTAAKDLEGYLPHSYRGVFLQDPVLAEAADWCTVSPDGIPASDLLDWLDNTVAQRAKQAAARRLPTGKRMSLGATFFRGTDTPLSAFESAVDFRESRTGFELRQHFHYMLGLAAQDDRAHIDAELLQIDKQLATAALAVKGCISSPPEAESVLLGLMPNYVSAGFKILPARWQQELRRVANQSVNGWSPYQILFGSYLGEQRHMHVSH